MNVSYKYEGVLKVIRRSRAILIFAMGVPIVQPRWVPENMFPPVREDHPLRDRRHLLVCSWRS